MNDRSADRHSDVDALLRATLADDLPTAVEGRLNRQVDRFLASRRPRGRGPVAAWLGPWRAGLSLRVAASAALLVSGVALHLALGPRAFAAPVGRVQESVALWQAIKSARSMECGDSARDDLGSPAEFADRVHRRWVLLASRRDAAGALELTFRSPSDQAQYELVVDRESMLPRRIVKTPLHGFVPAGRATAGYSVVCTWGAQTPEERFDGQR